MRDTTTEDNATSEEMRADRESRGSRITQLINAGRTYTVQPGDSLGGIAQAMYGDSSRWSEIFEANRDQLDNPDLIQVGQELRIP